MYEYTVYKKKYLHRNQYYTQILTLLLLTPYTKFINLNPTFKMLFYFDCGSHADFYLRNCLIFFYNQRW